MLLKILDSLTFTNLAVKRFSNNIIYNYNYLIIF